MKNSTVCLAFFLLAAALLARAACPLDGTKWKLTEWTISSLDPKDLTITLNIAGGKLSGSGGVNSYGGNCEAKKNGSLTIEELSSTLMEGPEPAMRAEAAYFKLLGDARSYKIKGDTLTLYDANGNESLIFVRVKK
jgi:heat shock protein HslJ